jgi:bla regulator protein blaR1
MLAAAFPLPPQQSGGAPVDPETRFEVASIKPSDPSATPRMSMSPGRYDVAGVRLGGIVSQAFRVPPNRIAGLPDWSVNERYMIAAKAPEGTPSTDSRAMFIMITNLLKDRFKLVTHTETREMPVFNLVFARNDKRFGPAFKESSAECRAAFAARVEEVRRGARAPGLIGPSECESVRINPGGTASLSGLRMDMIAEILTPYVGRPVIDKSELTSYYNVTLKWTPEAGSASVAPPGLPLGVLPLDPDAPNLFTAVQEQLGLKLESARAPLDVVVIDRLEKPTLD